MSIAPVVLVVDDDPAIRRSLQQELDAGGYTTITASNGLDGVRTFESHTPDLILTDLSMPRSDGFELISAVRAKGRTPIIVLSVRGDDADKIRALDLGADDFVTKPFSVAEMLARVRAQLRRIAPTAAALQFNGLLIDLERRRVTQGDRSVHLTPTVIRTPRAPRDERREACLHGLHHCAGVAGRSRNDVRHGSRPHEYFAEENRTCPLVAAVHRH